MHCKFYVSRRRFLRSLVSFTGAAAAPLALDLATLGVASAGVTDGDYKALICVFLRGGNDAYNTVLATDPASWAAYQMARTTSDAGSIALPYLGATGGVLPILPATPHPDRSFALHPELGPLKKLFDEGRAAILANVGPLSEPTTLAQFRSGSARLPPKLFSHNDQQSIWQSSRPEGAASGWGGRMADLLATSTGRSPFTCISTAGNAVFLSGANTFQYQITAAGAIPIPGMRGSNLGMWEYNNPLESILTARSANPLEADYAAIAKRAIESQGAMSAAMAAAGPSGVPAPSVFIDPNSGAPAENPLANQLQTVARIIAGRSRLSVRRQVFFVTLDGFDTHDFQAKKHAELMAKLAHGIAYFDSVAATLMGSDVRRQVTLFTASDFGRTLASNGDGSDHGWGAHHFVVGGAVRGREIYGSFPAIGIGHNLDVGSGILLPTTSVDQYGATLASWFGLSASQIAQVFPNIVKFPNRNLGFV